MPFRVKGLLLGTALAVIVALAFLLVATSEKTQAIGQVGIHVSDTLVTPNPVSPIDVATISTNVSNEGASSDHLGVVMIVRDQTGQIVLQEKQTGMSLASGNNLSVYWEWRIPGRLNAGTYSVEMRVVDENGNVLAADTNPQAFTVALPR